MSSSPQLKTEILNDVSHLTLDMTTFLSPRTAWLRLFNLIGRVLIITSDYIQDGTVTLDEWTFQASMLAVSLYLFVRSAWPLLLAIFSITSLTVRDRRAYALLFQAVGLTALQFKSLLVSKTLEWIEYKPYASVDLDGDFMYFLYSGEVTMSVSGPAEFKDSIDDCDSSVCLVSSRIIGDVQFVKALDESLYKSAMNSKRDKKTDDEDTTSPTANVDTPESRFVIGANGAAVLRISTHKLLRLMKNDTELSTSIQRLVLLCMQEKLSRALRHEGLVIQSFSGAASSTRTPNRTYGQRHE